MPLHASALASGPLYRVDHEGALLGAASPTSCAPGMPAGRRLTTRYMRELISDPCVAASKQPRRLPLKG
ncbi:hypothetical protein MRX96_038551 [Rhipicephalus microplus]